MADEGPDDAVRSEVLALLRENPRRSTDELARLAGTDPGTVEETVAELEASGVVRGYRAVVDPAALDDEPVQALVEINVTLDRETSYDDLADRLVGFPEVRSLRLVSGDYDFALDVEADTMGEVSRFVSEKVAPIPAISQTVTHYIMDTYKLAGIDLDERRDDDRLSVSP
jgi:DNA-binding Lrp family transcriptional regulator